MLAEIWALCMWFLQQMPYVVPVHFNTTFSSLSHRVSHSIENFWLYLNILIGNSFKSLISAAHTKVFRCTQSQKSRRLRSRDCIFQLTWSLRPICGSLKVLFRCCLTMCSKWGDDTCTICAVSEEEAHVPRVLVNHSPKIKYTAFLGKTTCPKIWLPKLPSKTLMENWCSCPDATVELVLVIHQEMGIIKVHHNIPHESYLITKWVLGTNAVFTM